MQAFALNHYLDHLDGYECEIIDFIPPALDNHRAFRIEGELSEKYSAEISSRTEKFEDFAREFYRMGSVTYHSDEEIEAAPPKYDIYVSGSDQIWNINFRISSRAYFLSFAPPTKEKYAFSTSCGRAREEKLSQYVPYINAYNKIFIRERTGIEKIRKVSGRDDIGWMADPTSLYGKSDWERWLPSRRIIDFPYIACYATLDDHVDQMMGIIEELHRTLNLPVVLFGMIIPREAPWIINKVDIGPLDFLSLIHDAEFVLTHSFHGTMFSINFNVPFLTFNDHEVNYRKTGLLEEFGLLGRIIHHEKDIPAALDSELDFSRINMHLKKISEDAKENIARCLQGERSG